MCLNIKIIITFPCSGFKGALFYIGNEDNVGKPEHAQRWRKHALAIKKVDPTIKTIFNCNHLNSKSLKKIVKQIGIDAVDGAEFHGKWPAGGIRLIFIKISP